MSVMNKKKRFESNPDEGTMSYPGETAYGYPVGSKVVEQILENRQIEARIDANSQAIAQLEGAIGPDLSMAVSVIESELAQVKALGLNLAVRTQINEDRFPFIDIRIDAARSDARDALNAVANAEAVATQNQSDILSVGNSLQAHEVRITGNENSFTSILDSSEQGGASLRKFVEDRPTFAQGDGRYAGLNDMSVALGNRPTFAQGDGRYVNLNDFTDLLAGQMTSGIVDQVAFSLADVEMGGVRQNLGTALDNLQLAIDQRPTMDFIRDSMNFRNTMGFQTNMPDWLQLLTNINGCFGKVTGGSAMRNLSFSLADKLTVLSFSFGFISTDMGKLKDDFGTYNTNIFAAMDHIRAELEKIRSEADKPSTDLKRASPRTLIKMIIDDLRGTFLTLRDELKNFTNGGGGYNGVWKKFDEIDTQFINGSTALEDMGIKAIELRNCGSNNLGW